MLIESIENRCSCKIVKSWKVQLKRLKKVLIKVVLEKRKAPPMGVYYTAAVKMGLIRVAQSDSLELYSSGRICCDSCSVRQKSVYQGIINAVFMGFIFCNTIYGKVY